MSSKRGRKRNDNLPPNRARDVQRAFRARRAAHLLALEQRVLDLELENARLRKMVGWPPDDRPPLGKGPTGKDKPKPFDPPVDFFSTRDSLSPARESSSTRTRSLSPSTITPDINVIDTDVWENALTMSDPHDQPEPQSPYTISSMSAPIQTKSVYASYTHPYPSPSPLPSSSRHSLPNMYLSSSPGYSHSDERHINPSYGSPSFVMRGTELREDHSRAQYSYSHLSYADADMHTEPPHSTPSPTPAPSQNHYHPQREPTNMPPHRRSFTAQFPLSHGMSHLSNPAHLSTVRQPEPHRVHDSALSQVYRMAYGPDGRLNSLP